MKPDVSCQKGVTLIELMVAMAITGIVAAAMFSFQQGQTRSYVTQEVVTSMQQNARGAMQFMTSEIRMAGSDPTGNAGARIERASSNLIQFTMDFSNPTNETLGSRLVDELDVLEEEALDDMDDLVQLVGTDGFRMAMFAFGFPDGSTDQRGEDITYSLNAAGDLVRSDNNNLAASDAVIAQNIDALDFVYMDEDGNRIGAAGDVLGPNQRGRIRTIQVTTIARAPRAGFSYSHTDTQSYNNPAGDPLMNPNPPNDNSRRVMLSTEIRLRNR